MSGTAGNLRPHGRRGRQKAEMFAYYLGRSTVSVLCVVLDETAVGHGTIGPRNEVAHSIWAWSARCSSRLASAPPPRCGGGL